MLVGQVDGTGDGVDDIVDAADAERGVGGAERVFDDFHLHLFDGESWKMLCAIKRTGR